MESATLLLFASGWGVLFGWQPMPDGSPSYEYIVQLEPELVATLEEGQSIPISSEVPDEIRPIGRIRVIVGRDPLPRQELTTSLKPLQSATEKKSFDEVIQTQYTVPATSQPGAGRYAAQPQPSQPILPPSQPILPPAGTTAIGNRGFAQTLQNAAQPVNEFHSKAREILPPTRDHRVVDSIQTTNQNLANRFRNTGESIRADAQQLFGNPARNVRTNSIQNTQNRTPSNPAILPPSRSAPQPTLAAPISPPTQRTDPTIAPQWQATPQTVSTRPPATHQPARTNLQAPLLPPATPTGQGGADRYANISNSTAGNTQPAGTATPFSQSPPVTNPTSGTAFSSSPNVPEIRGGMLSLPANADLQTASRQPVTTPTTNSQQANNFGWDLPRTNQPSPSTAAQPKDAPGTFALVLSWVLLSGSMFGNVYLVWNYFDVRHKYRGLVHDSRERS